MTVGTIKRARNGFLASRVWSRGITASYAYDALGQLTNVHYSGNTPDVSFAYDRLGRVVSAITAVSSHLFEYAGLDLVGEIQDGVAITRSYDAFGRQTGFALDGDHAVSYGYDTFGRLHSVSSSVCSVCSVVNYSCLPGSDLVSGYTAGPLAVTKTYEPRRNLISAVSNHVNPCARKAGNHVNPVLISAYDYANDAAGRRVSRNADSFGYNARSEVISAVIGTNDYGYAYDAIGNRIATTENTKTTEYLANELNQYTQISVPSVSSVVNPTYDADGNMTRLGGWYHTWDGENRLVQSQPYGFATNGAIRLEYVYNHKNLRVAKIKKRLSGRGASYPFDPSQPGTWDAIETRIFIYDGWLPVLEKITRTGGVTETREHVWGLDLSGTRGGAGGVGGLLATRINDAWFFPLYDANGNVTDYINEQGATVAHREYGPFGETLAASGPMADVFNFWFSTKYLHHETGLYYYGERYYSPELGRFLSRDPIGEEGGLNEYGFVDNDPVNRLDYLGKETIAVPKCHAYLILGHMIESKPIQWEFPDDCAFGGVVGCWPKQNNPKNPDNRWPNVPMHNEQMFVGLLKRLFSGVALQNIYFSEDHIGAEEQETDFAKAVENALSSVSFKSIVDSLCRSPCCCDNVVLTIQVTKGKWELEHGIKAHSLKPGMTITVKGKCSSRKK